MRDLAAAGESAFIDAVASIVASAHAGWGSGGKGPRGLHVGIGDDAAVVDLGSPAVLSTDAQVQGTHFELDWLSAEALGRKAFLVAFSDLSAMGARARWALLSLEAPASMSMRRGRALLRGFVAACRENDVALVGGNVAAAPRLALTVTAVGEAHRSLTRAAARDGDDIHLVGNPGDAAAGLELLAAGGRRGKLVQAWRRPPCYLQLGRALSRNVGVGAAIDLSDGLVLDLSRVAAASGLGALLDTDRLPLSRALLAAVRGRGGLVNEALEYALGGGEDYLLLFTARPDRRSRNSIASLGRRHGVAISRVGSMDSSLKAGSVVNTRGQALEGGYQHFLTSRGARA